jgi:hypothetical protein
MEIKISQFVLWNTDKSANLFDEWLRNNLLLIGKGMKLESSSGLLVLYADVIQQ